MIPSRIKGFAYGKSELAVDSAKWRDHFGLCEAALGNNLDTLWMADIKLECEDAVAALKG